MSAPSNPEVRQIVQSIRTARRLTVAAIGENLWSEHLTFQIAPDTSHILFLVGHLAWTSEEILTKRFSDRTLLPADWGTKFGMGVKPLPDAAQYPPFEEVMAQFHVTLEHALEAVVQQPDSILQKEFPEGSLQRGLFKTYGQLLLLTPIHEAYHAGQITMLRRAQGLPAGLGM